MTDSNWRALTLHQPWASAIITGPKRVENRPWAIYLPLPAWMAIHAGKTWDADGAEFCQGLWPETPAREEATFGAIIGAARVIACCSVEEVDSPWVFGPRCWLIDQVVDLEEPFSCRGYQGLWTPSAEVVPALEAAVTRAAREADHV